MSERGERQFFGEPLEQYGKKLEEEHKETELVPYGELLSDVGRQMGKVVETLENERQLAAEIRRLGGKITRETAGRIRDLEGRKNELLKVYEETLEPVRKDAAEAFLERAEILVPKPENVEALMTDPSALEVDDADLIEVQTVDALRAAEGDLQTEIDKSQEEMVGIIKTMHETRTEAAPLAARTDDPELRRSYLGVLDARRKELEARLRVIQDDAAAEELKRLDASFLTTLAEDIEKLSEKDRAEEKAQLREAYLAMLEAKLGELQNYVRAMHAKLAEVRTNLGFAERQEGKKAA